MKYWLLKSEPNVWSIKQQEKSRNIIDGHIDAESLLIDPSADFSDKYQAVLIDMLQGNHITQAEAQNIIDEFGKDNIN